MHPTDFLESLRDRGYTVNVQHLRLTAYDYRVLSCHPVGAREKLMLEDEYAAPKHVLLKEHDPVICPRGGATVVKAKRKFSRSGALEVCYTGISVCSLQDNFNKTIGLVKAVGRLRAAMLKDGAL